ncbi:unnamed protein product [Brachionus calyciflorus]|uniref:Uncharacterized protein n=1 Tax=Brachionus calyciflorus TaxID=104777 RepID=A0A813YYD0_9BILA|nr:unnamed protein product [Brachionus calyciflorus]
MSSQVVESNQLKFNLDTIVDKLNLVNIVHKPRPILIEKINSKDSNSRVRNDLFASNSQFEVIDEAKMSMYSFLVQRELKTKEWLSKYESNNFEPPVKQVQSKETTKPSKPITKNEAQSITSMVNPTTRVSAQKLKTSNSNELDKCCQDLFKIFENLFQIFNEFKDERLKIVYNDPIEEEKHFRIQIEQIKYLSRSIYNYQNQINSLRNQKKESNISQRLVHTIRQVIKLINSFSDIYPYRQDNNLTSEKLCFQFYKHLNLSIRNFCEYLNQSDYVGKFEDLIKKCDEFFKKDPSEKMEVKEGKNMSDDKDSKSKKSNQVLNVVRVSRSSAKKPLDEPIQVVSSKRVYDKKKPKTQTSNIRFEISPPRPKNKPSYENKTIKTGKMYPNKARSKIDLRPQNDLDLIPTKEKIDQKPLQRSFEQLNSTLNELDLNDQIYKPAFRHLSSPKLSKVDFNKQKSISRSRSRSADRSLNQTKIRKVISSESILNSDDDAYQYNDYYYHDPTSLKYTKSILKSNDCEKSNKLFGKLDTIRRENEALRRKYEKLSYHDSKIQSYLPDDKKKIKRPYEECYLDKPEYYKPEDFESKVTFNQVYKPLNGPSLDQLKRVVKYAEDFDTYNKKTSITQIGDTRFDDFELFEMLSNDLFEDLFESVYSEIENVNDLVARNLIENEFELEKSEKNKMISQSPEYDQSFEQTINSSRNFNHKSDISMVMQRKNSKSSSSNYRTSTKTESRHKTSKTSRTSNYEDNSRGNSKYQENDEEFVEEELIEEIDDVQDEVPNQVNTNHSSYYSHVEETISSISDD